MNSGLATPLDYDSIPWPPGMRITPRAKRFIAAYFGPANRVATEAAAIAGYASPGVRGSQLKRSLAEVIEAVELSLLEARTLSAERTMEGITEIALHGKQESNRLKALELMAKIHGLLSEKVNVQLSRTDLLTQLDTQLLRLQPKLPAAIDIEPTRQAPESHQE
jgi:hypothetical protein